MGTNEELRKKGKKVSKKKKKRWGITKEDKVQG